MATKVATLLNLYLDFGIGRKSFCPKTGNSIPYFHTPRKYPNFKRRSAMEDARIENQTEETQITITDTEWTEAERDQMRQHGYDDMDMLRTWLS